MNADRDHHTDMGSFNAWTKVGGPEAGTISALAIGGRTVFIGTKVGVFRSAGTPVTGWDRLSHVVTTEGKPAGGVPTVGGISIISLAVSPNFAEDRTVVAGTDAGLTLSTNAGDTWRFPQVP